MAEETLERALKDAEKISVDTKPIVYMFRPTHYVHVPREKLGLWEREVLSEVGVKPVETLQGLESISGCGRGMFDDCDWVN